MIEKKERISEEKGKRKNFGEKVSYFSLEIVTSDGNFYL